MVYVWYETASWKEIIPSTIRLGNLFNERITIFMIKLIISTNKFSWKKTVAKNINKQGWDERKCVQG